MVLPPDIWAKKKSIHIVDPDGWRVDGKAWNTMIREEEFDRRAAASTCVAVPAIKRWAHEAKGKILCDENGIIYVPYEAVKGGGYNAVTIHDPKGVYPPSGYNIVVSEWDVENDDEVDILGFVGTIRAIINGPDYEAAQVALIDDALSVIADTLKTPETKEPHE